MFKLSSLIENSVTKVGGAEISKFRPIPQFGDFRSTVLKIKGELRPEISLLHMKVLTLIKTKSYVFL